MKTKHISYGFLLLIIASFLISCSASNHPDERNAVKQLFEAFRNYSSEDMEKLISLKDGDVYFWSFSDEQFEAYSYLCEQIPSSTMFLRSVALKIKYSILSITETGNGCDIALRVKFKDCSSFAKDVFNTYKTYILTSKLDEIELLDREKAFDGIVVRFIAEDSYEYVSKDITLSLSRDSSGKLLFADNPAFAEIATGGLLSNPGTLTETINNQNSD
ncbi:MAG: hypothetical protein VB118_08140 [Oscillospiraceae bacterium]|nr:hypothetical protein [Oscillospiraceae bacterium]